MAGKTLALFAVCARRWELWIFVCSADEMPLVRLVWYLWLVYFWELKLTIVGREFAVSFWVGFFLHYLARLVVLVFAFRMRSQIVQSVRRAAAKSISNGIHIFFSWLLRHGFGARVNKRRLQGERKEIIYGRWVQSQAALGERASSVVGGLWVVVNLTRRFRVCDVRNKAECIWICVKWLSPISRLAN